MRCLVQLVLKTESGTRRSAALRNSFLPIALDMEGYKMDAGSWIAIAIAVAVAIGMFDNRNKKGKRKNKEQTNSKTGEKSE